MQSAKIIMTPVTKKTLNANLANSFFLNFFFSSSVRRLKPATALGKKKNTPPNKTKNIPENELGVNIIKIAYYIKRKDSIYIQARAPPGRFIPTPHFRVFRLHPFGELGHHLGITVAYQRPDDYFRTKTTFRRFFHKKGRFCLQGEKKYLILQLKTENNDKR